MRRTRGVCSLNAGIPVGVRPLSPLERRSSMARQPPRDIVEFIERRRKQIAGLTA
jgi:hypothetical protein